MNNYDSTNAQPNAQTSAFTDAPTTLDLNLLSLEIQPNYELWVEQVKAKVQAQQPLSAQEIAASVEKLPLDLLLNLTCHITNTCASKHFHTCAITNVKSGRCSEDCKWCAQSQHYETQVAVYGVKDPETCCNEAHKAYEGGVEMFSFVASGRRPNGADFKKLLETIDAVHAQEPIELCASLGLATPEMLQQLKAHGIKRYHCNLESSERFFPQLCSTHTVAQKIKTLQAAREAGLELCSGGIIGMGETMQDRLDLALTLRSLDITSVPINVLHPIPGTPLQNQPPLSHEKLLRSIALFRLALPHAALRFAGGRDLMSQQIQNLCVKAGINAAIVGTLLTTSNPETIHKDILNLNQMKKSHQSPQGSLDSQAAQGIPNLQDSQSLPSLQDSQESPSLQASQSSASMALENMLTPQPVDFKQV